MKNDSIRIRITFRKTEAVRYVSHLDMMRTFMRALRRSGLPIVYTEGFNVHPVMIFTPPLSVGYTSECEFLEVGLTKEMPLKEILKSICVALPEGFMATAVSFPQNKIPDMRYSVYTVSDEALLGKKADFESFALRDSVMVSKSTKSTTATVDVAPYIKDFSFEEIGGKGVITLTLPSKQEITVNPKLVIDAFASEFSLSLLPDYKRIAILGEDKKPL